ncbi:zf-HC2 domain-containing protein [Geomonas azotofigens]|nr:hypothetical protein [Geomonas azotofigens]MBU5613870.1 hypothetical protein [Geomonas azotofigens]
MECKEFREQVERFLQGKLDILELEDFAHHLIRCNGCETYLATGDFELNK